MSYDCPECEEKDIKIELLIAGLEGLCDIIPSRALQTMLRYARNDITREEFVAIVQEHTPLGGK